jgi:hypothetical protein
MSQNPYANYGDVSGDQGEGRTSVLAIMSLVASLSCCLSFLGPILGGIALLRISGSGGRRKGAGLAISGIIIGLAITALEVAFVVGAISMAQQGAAFMAPFSERIIAADPTALRDSVSPTLKAQITDADWARFKKEVTDELGTLQPPAQNIIELIGQYKEVGQIMGNQGNGNNNQIPVPLVGDKAKGVLMVHMPMRGARVRPPSAGGKGTPAAEVLMQAENFSVLLPSGKEVWLVPPERLQSLPPAPTPPSQPAPPAEGEPQPNGV